jgi:nucleoid-associated protein YgaU
VQDQIGRICRCAFRKCFFGLNGTAQAMHTDRKIGFAMGILLIGIVAALFFRNEPLVDTRVPIVRRERELNERLRERDVAVYLKEEKAESKEAAVPEDDHPWALRDVLKSMDARNKSRPSPIGKAKARTEADTVERPEELTSIEKFRTVKEAPDDDAGDLRPVPIPMPAASAIDTAKSDPEKLPPLMPVKPLETVAPLGEPGEPVVAEDPAFQIPEEFDEYTVKYGDTLSGIAEKMLGSQARYRDIYEANRDRMTSPDRLDVGKPLRIPRIAGYTPKVY